MKIGKKERTDAKTKKAYYNSHGLYPHEIHMAATQQESRKVAEANTPASLSDADLSNLPSTFQDLTIQVSRINTSLKLLQLEVSDIPTKIPSTSVSTDPAVLQRLEDLEYSNALIIEA